MRPAFGSRIGVAEAASPARDRVDVWRLPVAPEGWEATPSVRWLSEAERERAARMRLGARRWVAVRLALRAVLGHCLGVPPARVAIVHDAAGKPRLAPGAPVDLRFNLSHSGDVALLAVRTGYEVGIDVERIRDDVDTVSVAREILGEARRAEIAALAGARRREAFFRAWVRREALAKASGVGLPGPEESSAAADFVVHDLRGPQGFAAAVASEGRDWTPACVRTDELALA